MVVSLAGITSFTLGLNVVVGLWVGFVVVMTTVLTLGLNVVVVDPCVGLTCFVGMVVVMTTVFPGNGMGFSMGLTTTGGLVCSSPWIRSVSGF